MSDQLIDRKYARYQQLLNGIQKENPRLYDVLSLLSADVKGLLDVVDPIKATISRITSAVTDPPAGPTVFTASKTKTNIVFVWSSADVNVRFYELRKGTTWDTATFILRTSSLTAAINPEVAGSHTYLLKTLSGSLVECKDAVSTVLIVGSPTAPILTSQVIDNNVLLYWNEPASDWAVARYNVYKDVTKFAEITGTFITRFEAASGTFTYKVEAVDLAGNVGEQGVTQATVRQPPDYVLEDTRNIDLEAVTKVNCIYYGGVIVACIDLTETYENHFLNKSWGDPEDQVAAGYERWIQENLLTGSFVNDHDYGTVLSNIIVTVDYIKTGYAGTGDVSVAVKMQYKLNVGDAWSAPQTGVSQFFTGFRYLRITFEFLAANDDSMIAISNVIVNASVKREVDSGSILAIAEDPDGTHVFFNKTFKDVDSLTATADSLTPITVIADFVDVPNPTFFRVMAFDSAGQRVTFLVNWKARGIV